MTVVTLLRVIEAEENARFILRRAFRIAVMELHELVVEHPFTAHRGFRGLAVRPVAFDPPGADEMFQKWIVQRGRRLRVHLSQRQEEQAKQSRKSHGSCGA